MRNNGDRPAVSAEIDREEIRIYGQDEPAEARVSLRLIGDRYSGGAGGLVRGPSRWARLRRGLQLERCGASPNVGQVRGLSCIQIGGRYVVPEVANVWTSGDCCWSIAFR